MTVIIKYSEWFDVTQGLRHGCVLSPLLFKMFFTAVIHVVLVGVSEDEGIRRDLVRLEEDRVGGNEERLRSGVTVVLSREATSPARSTR